ncbi:LuxR family transcriptional regulator [Actinocorallia longicatena]|uniref:LuxR family transcriptional regulator n=2 Tax=Actinocorallia longicatena TaxID=111803 RepID=A0ABP6QJQ2_9ACTN
MSALLDALAQRGAVLAGPVGVGKSRLAAEAVRTLDRRRWHVVRAWATDNATDLPFGAFAHLLPPALPEDCVNPLGWATGAVLAGAAGKRVALWLDDAHLLDGGSAVLVHRLVDTHEVPAVVTVRSGRSVPEPIVALWKNDLLPRFDLGMLPAADTAEIVRAALGGPVEHATLARLHAVSQGNALYLHELVLGALAADRLQCRAGVWRLTGPPPLSARLAELVEARIGTLERAEEEALELIALGRPLDLDLLISMVGAPVVEELEARRLIKLADDGRIYLGHPLYGEAVVERCPTLRRQRHFTRLAEAVERSGAARGDEAMRLATWRLESGRRPDPEPLIGAAALALGGHDVTLADRLARAAIAAGGGAPASFLLAQILFWAERYDEVPAVLDDCGDLPGVALFRAMSATFSSGGGSAELWDLAPDVPQVWARRAWCLAYGGSAEEALALAGRVLADPLPDPDAATWALVARAWGLGLLGRCAEAAGEAERAAAEVRLWGDTTAAQLPQLLITRIAARSRLGDLDAMAADLAELTGLIGVESGWTGVAIVAHSFRARLLRLRGRITEALDVCRATVADPSVNRSAGPVALAELAHCAALAGEPGLAREALARAEAHRLPVVDVLHLSIDLARPWVSAAEGDLDAARAEALSAAESFARGGLAGPALSAFHDLLRLGVRDDRLAGLAAGHDGELAAVLGAHAAARDGAELAAAADGFERLGMLLHAAEVQVQAAEEWRLAGESRRAAFCAARAWRLAGRCQGAASPALRRLRAPELTRRELQIAHLAAEPSSSRDISERLTLSVRTVDNHLHAVYAKLGVTGREELSALFGDSE